MGTAALEIRSPPYPRIDNGLYSCKCLTPDECSKKMTTWCDDNPHDHESHHIHYLLPFAGTLSNAAGSERDMGRYGDRPGTRKSATGARVPCAPGAGPGAVPRGEGVASWGWARGRFAE